MFDINEWLRPNIKNLKPYTSARDEFQGEALVFLDANENPFDNGYNRYPDPRQMKLKQVIGDTFSLLPDQLFLGNGSDEAIDLLIRASCQPGQDRILTIAPTYGMYKVCADIQGVDTDSVTLNSDFSLPVDRLISQSSKDHKLLFICSPNNPTANSFDPEYLRSIASNFTGVVAVDEAYQDFSTKSSALEILSDLPNLVVLRTFSKAWGLAGIRFGMAIGNPEVIKHLNQIKYPYNLNNLTQDTVFAAIKRQAEVSDMITKLQAERKRLSSRLNEIPGIIRVYPSDTNFLLIQVDQPDSVYQQLLNQSIVVRNRSNQVLCEGCLRITVGTPEENDALVNTLKNCML